MKNSDSENTVISSNLDFISNLMKQILVTSKRKVSENRFFHKPYNSVAHSYRKLKGFINPYRSARVFVRKGIDRVEFFEILNARKVEYVLLRWWEDFPEIPDGEDMDILIKDDHRALISDLVTFVDNGTEMKCDIYTLSGSQFGSHKGIPYFQPHLASALLGTRISYRGIYVPSSRIYFASLAYHALFHKGRKSGLPGFGQRYKGAEHDYLTILKSMANSLKINIDISAKGVHTWLVDNGFAPAEDTLSKLVEINPELAIFQKDLYSDIRGGEFTVYVVRDRVIKYDQLEGFTSFLKEECGFDLIDVRLLNSGEKEICIKNIRGGRWDKGPYKMSGGNPAAIVSVFDFHPSPLQAIEQRKQSRMTNRNNLLAKYKYREHLNKLAKKNNYNGVHSSDNEQDGWFYISLLGKTYEKVLLNEVEKRRNRYARKGDLIRILHHDHHSKVEVIKFGNDLAITKTFRPGKEFYFEKELSALKELYAKFDFIPPILKAGEGFYIIPFLNNILDGLTSAQKKAAIDTKRGEILEIIKTLSYLGFEKFSPENLIITPEGKIFCTNLSYSRLGSGKRVISINKQKVEDADKGLSSPQHLWTSYMNKVIN